MKKIFIFNFFFIFFVFLFFVSKDVCALSSYDIGGTTYYSDGNSSYNIGGTTYFSNGGSAYNIGGTTYYNDGKGNSGSAYNIGGTTYFNQNNGYSGSAYNIGGTTYINDNQGNSGSAYNIGGTTYYNGNIFSTHNCPIHSTYNSLSDSCECNYGYSINSSKTACIYTNVYTYPSYPICPPNSYLDLSGKCKCNYGYTVSANGSSCLYQRTALSDSNIPTHPTIQNVCPFNSHVSATDSTECQCDLGYQPNSTKDGCVSISIKTNDQICNDEFGLNSKWNGIKNTDGTLYCICKNGYRWSLDQKYCIEIINKPIIIKKIKEGNVRFKNGKIMTFSEYCQQRYKEPLLLLSLIHI